MANTIFNNMVQNEIPEKPRRRGLKILIFLLIFLIVLAITGIIIFIFLKNQVKTTPKEEFISYLGKTNISNNFNFEMMKTLNTRLDNETSESTSNITVNLPWLLENYDFDISEGEAEIVSQNNPVSEKSSSDITLKYKDNDLLNFNVLTLKNKIGIFSEDIVTEYIGSNFSNFNKIVEKFVGTNEILDNIDLNKLKNTDISIPDLPDGILTKYLEVINGKVPENSFSSKKVTLDRDSEKIDVTEYTMTLTEEQWVELSDQLLKTLENDDELLDVLLNFLGDDKEEVKESLKSRNRNLYKFII